MVVTGGDVCEVYKPGYVKVESGIITELGRGKGPKSGDKVIEHPRGILIPGLIAAHTHLYGILSHGMPVHQAPKDFRAFLYDYWWPNVEDRLDKRSIKIAAKASAVEMVKTGTTCFGDILEAPYSLPAVLRQEAESIREVGLRGVLSIEASERVDTHNGREALRENAEFIRATENDRLIRGMICTHTLFTCSSEFLQEARKLADNLRVGVHIHAEEGAYETQYCLEKYGKLPMQIYEDIGYLRSDLLVSQCVHTKREEIELLKKRNCKVAHMPLSNCEVGGGIAPVKHMIDAGIQVALGTDSYITDMFEVMRSTYLIHKGYLQDATVMPSEVVFKMATIWGARALGLGHLTGSLEAGKRADMVLVEPSLSTPLTPGNVLTQLVQFTSGRDVKMVLAEGALLVQDGTVLTTDEETARSECAEVAKSLWR
jgi:cytosine/adenosine deaminase-related metal-dependent hydrolase